MDTSDTVTKRGRGRKPGARGAGRPRGRGRGRGRGRKASRVIESDEEVSPEQQEPDDLDTPMEEKSHEESIPLATIPTIIASAIVSEEKENEILLPTIDMEADISQLEAPTFTTISRGPPEPMLRLKWDHKVSLIGEKVLNPMIHCCDQCEKPILIYGRMIPCKHVFCLPCARSEPIKICPRCKEKVVRVEKSGLGSVFMCTHGGSRYGNTGCRRTYLSSRDLQAHINHRHVAPLTPTAENKVSDSKILTVAQRKGSISGDLTIGRQQASNRSGQTFAQDIQQSSTPIGMSLLHHHQPPQTAAQDLSNYFSPSQSQYAQTASYVTATQQANSQQSFATSSINMGQQSISHHLPVVTSSTSFYTSSYAPYNSVQSSPQNVHYSNASAYQSGTVIQSTIPQQQLQQGQSQQNQSQSSWQQQPYYR